jgi:hypothetical protein
MKNVMLALLVVINWNGLTIPIVYLYLRKARIAWTILSVKLIKSAGIRVKDMLPIKLNSA